MNNQVDATSSNLASVMLNSKIRPRDVVGYGVKIFHPSPPNYVTRSLGIVLLYCLDWLNMKQTKQVKIILVSFAFQAQFEFALTAVAEEVNAILQALAK